MERPGNPRQFVACVATSSHLQWQLSKVGINDCSNHVNARLASKRNLLLNTEYHGTDRYLTVILFLGERGRCFSNTPTPPQTVQACQSGCPRSRKKTKNKTRYWLRTPKYRAQQFPKSLKTQILSTCCQLETYRYVCKGQLWPKASVTTRKTLRVKGKNRLPINLNGEEMEFRTKKLNGIDFMGPCFRPQASSI